MGPVRWLDRLGLRRPRPEESVELEVEHHIAELTDRLVAQGMDVAAAQAEAERRFGDPTRYRPRMRRAERALLLAERWTQRIELLRISGVAVGRFLRTQPILAAGIVLTLALGIGANATMYQIIDRLLLSPPAHIVDPDRVVRVHGQVRFNGRVLLNPLTYPDYEALRTNSGFAAIAVYRNPGEANVENGESTGRIQVAHAAAQLFPLLGVTPVLGRFYTPEEAQVGAEATVVLSYEYWRSRFGGDVGVLGRSIEIERTVHTIIGVTPAGFTGVELGRVDAWLPLERSQGTVGTYGCYCYTAVARLADGASTEAASAEAYRIVVSGREAAGESTTNVSAMELTPLIAARGPQAGAETRVARWLSGVSLMVLLIACANVANLLTARGVRRRKEVGVRLALGAGRRAVVAQAVIESVMLATIGAGLALAIAEWGGAVVRSTLLPDVFFPSSALSPRLIVFTVIAAIGSGLLAGILPALQAHRADVLHGLKEGGASITFRSSRARGFLTVLQAAMTVVLLVGAGLFARSVAKVRGTDLGLDVDQLVAVVFDFDPILFDPDRSTEWGVVADLSGAAANAARSAWLNDLHEDAAHRIESIPGVVSATTTGSGLGSGYVQTVRAEGVDSLPRLPTGGPYQHNVSPGYFATVGLTVLEGREILPSDGPDDERVAVLGELMARLLWPAGDAIGRCIYIGARTPGCTRVVGIVEDQRYPLGDEPSMAYYLPGDQTGRSYNTVYVRTEDSPDDLVAPISVALRSIRPEVQFADVRTLRDYLDPQARSWTLGAAMFTLFGVLALIVASVGLYGVLAFDVAQRTRELGIRTALGAEKMRLLTAVLARGAGMAAFGVALGASVAYLAAPYIGDLLYETSPHDPSVFGGVSIVLLAVGVLASVGPGLRATRVDPMTALKSE